MVAVGELVAGGVDGGGTVEVVVVVVAAGGGSTRPSGPFIKIMATQIMPSSSVTAPTPM